MKSICGPCRATIGTHSGMSSSRMAGSMPMPATTAAAAATTAPTAMNVRAVEFNYNLVAMSETRQANYLFAFDPEKDDWSVFDN